MTFASVTQRESNRLHDAPLLYTPRTITTSLHFPARTPGKARGAGGTRVAGTSRTSPLVAGRARARSRSRAPRPSRARILIGRSGRSGRDDRDTSTSRLPRALDPGPGLSPSSRWARRSSSPPGARLTPTAATRWRSRQRRCPTARWRRSGSSRPTTEARISSARGAAGRVGTRPRRWARRPCGACAGTRRARSALAPRAMGWRSRDTPRGRSGSGGDPPARRRPSPRRGARSVLRASSDSDAARDASRRETARVGARERDSGITKGALGVGHRSIAFEKPFAASSRTPGDGRASVAVERSRDDVGDANVVSRARLASETILSRSAKRYVSPFQAERAKQATIRALKAKGEWPNPKPPVVVIPGTTEEAARKKPTCAPSPTSTRSIRAR